MFNAIFPIIAANKFASKLPKKINLCERLKNNIVENSLWLGKNIKKSVNKLRIIKSFPWKYWILKIVFIKYKAVNWKKLWKILSTNPIRIKASKNSIIYTYFLLNSFSYIILAVFL